MDYSMPGLPVPHHLLKFAQVHVNCISDVIQPSHPLTPSSPSALNLSQNQGFFYESVVCIRWPKSWSFNFSIRPSSEYSGLISLKIDWFDHLHVQGILKSLLQHYSSKASIFQHSVFFTVQLLQLYMTTGKTIALIVQTFVGRVMSLLFNIPAKKQTSDFMAAVTNRSDFRIQEEEICHCFLLYPFYVPWSNGARCHDLSFL